MRKIRLTERRKLGGDCGGKKGQGPEGGTWCEGGSHRSGLYCSHVGYCKANSGDMITTSTGGGKTKYPKEASKYITEERKLGEECGGKGTREGGAKGGTWCLARYGGGRGLYCSHSGFCEASPDNTITTSTGGKTKYQASKYITIKESDLINIIRRMVNEAEAEPKKHIFNQPTPNGDGKPSGRRGPTTKKLKKASVAPAPPPAAAPPCAPPNGPNSNGLGIYANATGAAQGTGCCGKCDNLPNPTGPFTPAELTYLGPCATHCGCCI